MVRMPQPVKKCGRSRSAATLRARSSRTMPLNSRWSAFDERTAQAKFSPFADLGHPAVTSAFEGKANV
jgi:hypothetical protein